jgi:hypothetical protein
MISKLLCRFGIHLWHYENPHRRTCLCCHKQQHEYSEPRMVHGRIEMVEYWQ